MAPRSQTQLMKQTRRIPRHAVGIKGGPASRAIPRSLGSARLGSRKRIRLVRSTCGPSLPPLGSIHLTRPVEHIFERHGADPLFLGFFRASMNPFRDARQRRLAEVVELVRFDIADDLRDRPSAAIRPLDPVHVDIGYAAPKLQAWVRDCQECSRRLSRPRRRSSRPCRRLQVPDGRHDHGRPQTSIATLVRRFSVTSLNHRAHGTSHPHHLRKSPHRRPPVERAPRDTVPWAPSSCGAPSRAALRECRRAMDM
jgi:hypothetical protein